MTSVSIFFQMQKMSETELVRILQNRKVSESFETGKFQKLSKPKKCQNLKMSKCFKTGKCQYNPCRKVTVRLRPLLV